jgi:hypothetical protein
MNFKRTVLTATVAFASAFAAVGLFNYLGWNKQEVSIIENNPGKLVNYVPSGTAAQPIDFRYAAATSTPSVVHIKSTYKPEKATSQRNS